MAVKPYMMPIFLWSIVKTQLFQPVVAVGRRNTPSAWLRRDHARRRELEVPRWLFDDGHRLVPCSCYFSVAR